MKKIVSGIMLTLLFMGILTFSINIKPAKSTWTGTVYIRADGSIEPLDAPIITYNNVTYTLTDNITSSEDGIVVERDNIMIDGSGYTLQGTGEESYKGVDLNGRSNVTIKNIIITKFYYGIYLYYSSNSSIVRNTITANNYCGIYLGYSSNNSIYDNNFVDNARNAYSYNSMNVWDNGYPSGGNYWSDYNGTDLYSDPYQNDTGSDGIGDTSYIIDEDNADRYPLMGPFNCFNTSIGYFVHVISNSTIEKFEFFESNNSIRMVVSNITANQTIGFCRLTIPHILVAPPYNIAVNNTSVEYNTIFENETLSIIYFAYERSKLEIVIIPEFAPALIMQIFIIMSMLVILITKKKFFLEL